MKQSFTSMTKFITTYNDINKSSDDILGFIYKLKVKHEKDKEKSNKNDIERINRKLRLEEELHELAKRNPIKFDFKHLNKLVKKLNAYVMMECGED